MLKLKKKLLLFNLYVIFNNKIYKLKYTQNPSDFVLLKEEIIKESQS
jgi:hypothetical protein